MNIHFSNERRLLFFFSTASIHYLYLFVADIFAVKQVCLYEIARSSVRGKNFNVSF